MIDHWTPPPSAGGRSSALWGYTAPDGREYALFGGFDGTYIIDISETPVRLVTRIPGPSNGWRELKTSSHYAYVVSEGGAGLQIIDLYDLPATARLVRSDTSVFRTGHTISAEGRYIYVHGTNTGAGANGGTIVFDVGPDPEHPQVVGKYTDRYVHDAMIYNDTMYASAITSGRLDLVYLGADRRNPTNTVSITYPGAGTHNADLTADHRYVMTTDEIGATPKTLKIWDLADRQNIVKVADYTPVPGEIVHNVHTKGRLAVVAWYTAGTRIIDMSNPREPAEVGFFDTYDGASSEYAGNWETYPYFPSGRIIASDMQNGLYVFTFNGVARGRVFGTVRDAVSGLPVSNALITFPELNRSVRADALGNYVFAGAVDTLSFRASALNYKEGVGVLSLAPASGADQGTRHDIVLQPIPLASVMIRPVDAETGDEISRFAFTVSERSVDQTDVPGPYTTMLPRDSTYHLTVGAWGYRQTRVTLRNVKEEEVVVPMHRGYHDNVECNLRWSLATATDTAQGGRWERGHPWETELADRIVQPGTQTTPGGAHAFFTGLAGSNQGGAGANDVDNGQTSLTTPRLLLADSSDPWLNASWWYSRDVNPTDVDDTLEFLVSNDNGASWTRIDAMTDSPDAWGRSSWRIRDYVDPTDSVLFRIVASDFYRPSLVEAGVDDFVVSEGGPGNLIEDTLTVDGTPTQSVGAPGARITGSVFPNPASTDAEVVLNVERELRNATLEIFDVSGHPVLRLAGMSADEGIFRILLPTSVLSSGVYRWSVTERQHRCAAGTFVVAR